MPDSSVATPAPSASVITRPAANTQGDRPVVLRSLPEAGAFVTSFAPAWRYDGRQQKLDFPASTPASLEHAAPAGGLIAIERQTQTPGRYLVSTELAIRDRSNGPDRTVYRAPVMFYWSGWSPDGRYVLIWEVDFFSGSVDMDGRPLIVIDARTGMRFDLGRTLLHGTTAWSPPHTLAFAAGFGREVSQEKTLRLWAPETGIRDVSPIGTAALAPIWNASGQSLYFVSGPAGEYDPRSPIDEVGGTLRHGLRQHGSLLCYVGRHYSTGRVSPQSGFSLGGWSLGILISRSRSATHPSRSG